jgi:hypothetical protein
MMKTTLALASFLSLSSASMAEQIHLSVEKDASVIRESLCCSNPADANFGQNLTVDAGQYHHVSEALLGFDLGQIPEGAVIKSAQLVLGTVRLVGSEPAPFRLGTSSDDWAEETVTWNNRPTNTAQGNYELKNGSNAIDVSAWVIAAREAGEQSLTRPVPSLWRLKTGLRHSRSSKLADLRPTGRSSSG